MAQPQPMPGRNRRGFQLVDGQARSPFFTLPAMGSVEFYLWVLILAEISALVYLRRQFAGAHGG